ncbi:MAG: dihydrofolate reductase [Muribaculum sp.]|nr:dihydrofolate reductase [Muribaculum sp.]
MIAIIAAVARDGAIGINGDLIWHLPGDLPRFKALTLDTTLVMGRKTWESLPFRPLKDRRNIIVTRNADYVPRRKDGTPANAQTAPSLQSALTIARMEDGSATCMIIGGGEIYRQAMPYADTLYITYVDATCEEADTRFPEINPEEWQLVEECPGTESTPAYTFRTYKRIFPREEKRSHGK